MLYRVQNLLKKKVIDVDEYVLYGKINEKGFLWKQFKFGNDSMACKINFLMSSLLKIGHA